MSQFVRPFRSLLSVRYAYSDLADQQRSRDLLRMAWLLILFGFGVIVVYTPLSVRANSLALGVAAALLVSSIVIVPVLINRGQLVSASLAFVVALFVVTVFTYVSTASPSSLTFFS